MKLISFKPDGIKWEFTVEYKGEQKSFLLKEKYDWPCLLGSELALVEKWLLNRYGSLAWLCFGILK